MSRLGDIKARLAAAEDSLESAPAPGSRIYTPRDARADLAWLIEQVEALATCARNLLEVDGAEGSRCYDASKLLHWRALLAGRAAIVTNGQPQAPSANQENA